MTELKDHQLSAVLEQKRACFVDTTKLKSRRLPNDERAWGVDVMATARQLDLG
jgi:hypothetical protein